MATATVAFVTAVIFAYPWVELCLSLTSLPTSVETHKSALAVKVLPVPLAACGVIVTSDTFISRYGPSKWSNSVIDQALWAVLVSFLGEKLGCVIYSISADWVNDNPSKYSCP